MKNLTHKSIQIFFSIAFLLIFCYKFNVDAKEKEEVPISELSLKELIEKSSNFDVKWQGHEYHNAIIVGQYAMEIYQRKNIQSIPLLIKALEEKKRILVAHVLLTKMLIFPYGRGWFEFNNFNLRAYQKNPKSETDKIIKYWQEISLNKISDQGKKVTRTNQILLSSPKWFLDMTMKKDVDKKEIQEQLELQQK